MAEARIAAELPVEGALAAGIAELRANVIIALGDTSQPAIAVTSATGAENRRRVAAHLAAALAATGRRVLLLDADVAAATALVSSRGVPLNAPTPATPAAAPVPHASGVACLTADAVSASNPALLVSVPFRQALEQARATYDLLVLACPAILEVAEARAIAALCTGALVVVTQGSPQRSEALRAAAILQDAGVRALGAVIQYRA